MKVKNVTSQEIEAALKTVNKKYENNIVFKRFEQKGKQFVFTLTVKNSKKAGGRIGNSGKRVAAACWHVHGDFFDALLEINENAVITTCSGKIDKNNGNWQDRNIGSIYEPLMYSEACNC